ncbi:MAG: hypothetical protein IPM98_20730 [Lewinellaceae bacterium]|nr:hypothetical protein [Lewinellaceae bacterium]
MLQYIQTYHPSFSPANRTPDPNYAWYSVLKKVTFPTGGSAEYEYESNQLPVCDSINIPSNALTSEAVNFTGTPQTKTKDFYLPSDQWVQINYYVLMNGFRCDGASSKITALDAGNPFTGLTWGGCAQMVSPIELQGSVSWFLKAGNYRLEVKVFQGPESGYPPPFSTSPESATLAVQYVSYTPSFIVNEVTGGIRVKKITLSDGLSPNHSPNIVKAYKYHKADQGSCPDASSGYYMGRYARYLTQDYSIIDPSSILCDYELMPVFSHYLQQYDEPGREQWHDRQLPGDVGAGWRQRRERKAVFKT